MRLRLHATLLSAFISLQIPGYVVSSLGGKLPVEFSRKNIFKLLHCREEAPPQAWATWVRGL